MPNLSDLQSLYASYLSEAADVECTVGPLGGLWGFGRRAADDPCHDRFARNTRALLGDIAQENLPSAQVRDILAYIYDAPLENKKYLSSFWMLTAVQGLTLELIPLLDGEDARTLWLRYANCFPRHDRLPVQEKVFEALTQQASCA